MHLASDIAMYTLYHIWYIIFQVVPAFPCSGNVLNMLPIRNNIHGVCRLWPARPLSTMASSTSHVDLHKKIDSLQSTATPMTHQKFSGRKRFYKQVSVQKVSVNEVGDIHYIP
jgi:hypothetical protein